MSDAKEEERANHHVSSASAPFISLRGSVRSLRRSHKPRDLPLPPSYSPYPVPPPRSASPRKRHFEIDSVHHSPGRSTHGRASVVSAHRIARGTSAESDSLAPIASNFREDENMWQSLELRESMERARARYLQRRVQ